MVFIFFFYGGNVVEETIACSKCEKKFEICSLAQIRKCLKASECEQCGSPDYNYPYGYAESRHCIYCGAEWPVYK